MIVTKRGGLRFLIKVLKLNKSLNLKYNPDVKVGKKKTNLLFNLPSHRRPSLFVTVFLVPDSFMAQRSLPCLRVASQGTGVKAEGGCGYK